jgi:hypothetical protein
MVVKPTAAEARSADRPATTAEENTLEAHMQHSTSGDGDFLSGLVGGGSRRL